MFWIIMLFRMEMYEHHGFRVILLLLTLWNWKQHLQLTTLWNILTVVVVLFHCIHPELPFRPSYHLAPNTSLQLAPLKVWSKGKDFMFRAAKNCCMCILFLIIHSKSYRSWQVRSRCLLSNKPRRWVIQNVRQHDGNITGISQLLLHHVWEFGSGPKVTGSCWGVPSREIIESNSDLERVLQKGGRNK
jgi:hypothetical protein